jgi:hypothetical protein
MVAAGEFVAFLRVGVDASDTNVNDGYIFGEYLAIYHLGDSNGGDDESALQVFAVRSSVLE